MGETRRFFRIILLLLPPFIIFLAIFLPSYYNIVRIPDTNTWTVEEKPTIITSIKNIIEVPFELKWYTFCFEDKNTTFEAIHLTEPQIIETDKNPNITLVVYRFGTIPQYQSIKRGYKYCIDVNLKEDFKYEWFWQSQFDINETTVNKCVDLRYKPNIDVKIKPQRWMLLAKFILLMLAWWALILLIAEVLDFASKKETKKLLKS